jgi:formyl-CoA transferase
LGRPEWTTDDRYATNAARLENREELERLIGEIMIEHPRDTWHERFREFGIAHAPIQTTDELVNHEQIKALAIICDAPGDTLRTVGSPLSFDGKRPAIQSAVGPIGKDNQELDELLHEAEPRPYRHISAMKEDIA